MRQGLLECPSCSRPLTLVRNPPPNPDGRELPESRVYQCEIHGFWRVDRSGGMEPYYRWRPPADTASR
jgi:hypothetical protein